MQRRYDDPLLWKGLPDLPYETVQLVAAEGVDEDDRGKAGSQETQSQLRAQAEHGSVLRLSLPVDIDHHVPKRVDLDPDSIRAVLRKFARR
jgi:hypothetical protein